jgi:TM2 domain-containing membrane protein YozV
VRFLYVDDESLKDSVTIPVQKGYAMNDAAVKEFAGKKIAAGLCGILIGALGIHKFLLGFTQAGIIMVCVSVISCGFLAPVMGIIGLIEGIMYLTKSDEEFYQTYAIQKKEWF